MEIPPWLVCYFSYAKKGRKKWGRVDEHFQIGKYNILRLKLLNKQLITD